MELTIKRSVFNKTNTIGKLYINNKFFSHTLEDVDRGLQKEDSITKIKNIKVTKTTCIPYGRYRVILSYSNKLKRYLPLILDVPGFKGIRIHKGRSEKWSSGCPLMGYKNVNNVKLNNIETCEKDLLTMLDSINKIDSIYITIVKSN